MYYVESGTFCRQVCIVFRKSFIYNLDSFLFLNILILCYSVILGQPNYCDPNTSFDKSMTRSVKNVEVHPYYRGKTDSDNPWDMPIFDIALLEVSVPMYDLHRLV